MVMLFYFFFVYFSCSLGSIDLYAERIGFTGQNAISLDSHLSNQKGSSDSIPEGMKEKQRSFSGIYLFMI